MYALILWLQSKTTSIINASDLTLNKDEGEITTAKYHENNKLYRVKIVRKSADKNYLSLLKVTTEGEILQKGKNTSSQLAKFELNNLKSKKKQAAKKRAQTEVKADEALLRSKPVFETSESEDDDDEISKTNDKEENDSDNSTSSESETPQRKIAKLEEELEKTKKLLLSSKNINSTNGGPSTSSTSAPRKVADDVAVEGVEEPATGSHGLTENLTADRPQKNENPLETCRKAGNGRVLLVQGFNVWIDQGDLTYIQRWNNPKEMTRQLLRHLVGEQNLIKMCARGNSKSRPAVPKDIVSCIEYYVNKKCKFTLSPSEFTDVINYMCGTLRANKK